MDSSGSDIINKNRLNFLIKQLIELNFEVKMFPASTDPTNQFYILLNLSISELEKNAEELEYLIKMTKYRIKYKFSRAIREKFEPLRSKDKQEIIYNLLNKHININ